MKKIITAGNTPVTEEQKRCLLDKLERIYDAIADEAGMNVSYDESMDGSILPHVVLLSLDAEEADLGSVDFLAENGFILPRELQGGTRDEFKAYLDKNERDILSEVESVAESDYRDRCSELKTIPRMKRYIIIESWHNRCDNATEFYAECRNEGDAREILAALSVKFKRDGLGDDFPPFTDGYELMSQFYDNIADFWLQKNDEEFMSSEYRRRFQVIENNKTEI